jgi:hypothetical protein
MTQQAIIAGDLDTGRAVARPPPLGERLAEFLHGAGGTRLVLPPSQGHNAESDKQAHDPDCAK